MSVITGPIYEPGETVESRAVRQGVFFFKNVFNVCSTHLGGWSFIGNLSKCLLRMIVGSYCSAMKLVVCEWCCCCCDRKFDAICEI